MRTLSLLLIALLLASCSSSKQPGKSAEEELKPVSVQHGIASYYAGRWIGRKTANGEIYRASDRTAAHRTLPFNTRVRVTDKRTGTSTIVRINNRGPYAKGRVIDLSLVAAREIGLTKRRGIARVKLEVLPPKAEKEASREEEEKKEEKRSVLARLFAPKKPATNTAN